MTLEQAIQIAALAHEGQTDKGGEPYILHPLRVMQSMRVPEEWGSREGTGEPGLVLERQFLNSLRIVAVLHDVFEDNPAFTIEGLHAKYGLLDVEQEALRLLTHKRGVPYRDYIAGLAPNVFSRFAKRGDLADNMRLERIPNPTPKDLQRVRKYADSATFLAQWKDPT